MGTIELVSVEKSYGATKVLHGIDLNVADGEFVVLVGPSGCGKSTLLRTIAGLEEATAGDILLSGRRVNDATPKERNVAMVFQNYALYPHMSVRENIGLNLKIARRPKAEIAERVETAARLLDIASLLDRRPAQLSGGQRQRVAMGRAIVRDPEVFLFDEPLSNLDAKLRVQMRAEIKGLQAKVRKTSIYVTHDQVEAMTLADRVVVMNGGRIEQQGTPMELYLRPANRFVAGFIGSPGMNFIPVRFEGGAAVTAAGGRLPVAALGHVGEAVAGVRPEDLSLVGPEASLRGQVTLIEPMGAQTHLAVSHGESTLWIAVAGMPPVEVGQEVGLSVAAGLVHVFDAGDGRRLVA